MVVLVCVCAIAVDSVVVLVSLLLSVVLCCLVSLLCMCPRVVILFVTVGLFASLPYCVVRSCLLFGLFLVFLCFCSSLCDVFLPVFCCLSCFCDTACVFCR